MAIAIASGWLLGISYTYYNTIWVAIGMHWAWNFLEGNIFGCPVSGEPPFGTHLITPVLLGEDIMTGGSFGPEASIITVIVGVVFSTIYTLLYHIDKRKIIRQKKKGKYKLAERLMFACLLQSIVCARNPTIFVNIKIFKV